MRESEQAVLVERLGRYPAERYPVQHATTQFHLGSVLLHAGETASALQALTAARDVFTGAGMRLERAKATVMLGVALRAAGRAKPAAEALHEACAILAELDAPAERAAAAYNLALVLSDAGDPTGAHQAWSSAQELFLSAGYPGQAAAAARDHGASLLTSGDVDGAVPLLELASSLAERAGDDPGTAAAANVLGLAHLAADNASAAVAVLRRALGFVPRSTRPTDYAMVKANLALAHERAGSPARARLAARQAVAVASSAPPVRAQAQELLARLPGSAPEDLLEVLDEQDRSSWAPLVREDVLRVADSSAGERRVLVVGLLDGLLTRPAASYDLAESLLQVVLELPPRWYELLVAAIVDAVAGRPEQDVARLQAVFGSAMARFALPQWQRLAASLNAAAEAAGLPATWR